MCSRLMCTSGQPWGVINYSILVHYGNLVVDGDIGTFQMLYKVHIPRIRVMINMNCLPLCLVDVVVKKCYMPSKVATHKPILCIGFLTNVLFSFSTSFRGWVSYYDNEDLETLNPCSNLSNGRPYYLHPFLYTNAQDIFCSFLSLFFASGCSVWHRNLALFHLIGLWIGARSLVYILEECFSGKKRTLLSLFNKQRRSKLQIQWNSVLWRRW